MELDSIKEALAKLLGQLKERFQRVRIGRVNPALLHGIMVDVYGVHSPIESYASITTGDARTLVVTVWQSNYVSEVDRALRESNLGVNTVVNGNIIRVLLPPLSEERRKEYIRLVKTETEAIKVKGRDLRHRAIHFIETKLKEKEFGKDEAFSQKQEVQHLLDKFIKDVETLVEKKEKDLLDT